MAIVLVEQYFDFASDLADDFLVMDRGAVVIAGDKGSMVEAGGAQAPVGLTQAGPQKVLAPIPWR